MWHLLAQQQTTSKWADIIDSLARTPLSQVVTFVLVCSVLRLALAPYLAKVPAHQRTGLYHSARIFNETLDAVIYAAVFVFLIIRPFCIQAFRIPSGSMLNTLQINDYIVANKAIYRYSDPKFQDIIVFRPPSYAVQDPSHINKDGNVNVDYIKRCIGVPGDIIEIRGGVLYRNNAPVREPYVEKAPVRSDLDFKLVKHGKDYWPLLINGDLVNDRNDTTAEPYRLSDRSTMDRLRQLPPAAIPPGHYLMIGDNRGASFDGRSWGLISREAIIGRSEFIWLPINRWQSTR